jgi:hypothetical protein
MLPYRYMDNFEWDENKSKTNKKKHKVSFEKAQLAFKDKKRIIYEDITHSTKIEKRHYCIGKIEGKICTVRFTYRNKIIRIIGAGYWRKERKKYEKNKK